VRQHGQSEQIDHSLVLLLEQPIQSRSQEPKISVAVNQVVSFTTTIPPDTTPPVITLNGSTTMNIVQGASYIESGASCMDNRDSSCTVVVTGSVNTAVVGNYTITYRATDAAGNVSTADRTVNVTLAPDTTPPVITLNGSDTIYHTV
jgi:hypothetical protein